VSLEEKCKTEGTLLAPIRRALGNGGGEPRMMSRRLTMGSTEGELNRAKTGSPWSVGEYASRERKEKGSQEQPVKGRISGKTRHIGHYQAMERKKIRWGTP